MADNSLGDEALAALAPLGLLDTLDVAGNGLTRVAHLAALRSLRVLILSDNAITDLTPLAALTGLEILDLGDNIVSDLRPLRGLRRLRQLNLDNNLVRDVAPLTALPQLRRVELSGNPLARSTLSALRQRGVEVTFYAEAMTISSERVEASIRKALDRPVGPLDEVDFLRIRELVISGAVETLGGVEHLKNLEMLSVRGNRALLNDLTPLAELERMRTINIIGAPIADLRPLRDLSLLTSLRVSIGRLTTLNGLGRQIELRELILTGNQIREIHEIRRSASPAETRPGQQSDSRYCHADDAARCNEAQYCVQFDCRYYASGAYGFARRYAHGGQRYRRYFSALGAGLPQGGIAGQ